MCRREQDWNLLERYPARDGDSVRDVQLPSALFYRAPLRSVANDEKVDGDFTVLQKLRQDVDSELDFVLHPDLAEKYEPSTVGGRLRSLIGEPHRWAVAYDHYTMGGKFEKLPLCIVGHDRYIGRACRLVAHPGE
jgi:hypothetical protein